MTFSGVTMYLPGTAIFCHNGTLDKTIMASKVTGRHKKKGRSEGTTRVCAEEAALQIIIPMNY
jgi:hypothetical protein